MSFLKTDVSKSSKKGVLRAVSDAIQALRAEPLPVVVLRALKDFAVDEKDARLRCLSASFRVSDDGDGLNLGIGRLNGKVAAAIFFFYSPSNVKLAFIVEQGNL